MKKLLVVLAVVSIGSFCSCTDNSLEEIERNGQAQNRTEFKIDPEKDCPENDRNCNGVPDDQE
ncbi:hypothetical protein TPENAI_60906 [Tenacibaculum litopenaei]|uniref:hypothetical protein n=1 Tax=Tenacibaculum litopenaei TaxID=396016 RepID=UPI0038943CD6